MRRIVNEREVARLLGATERDVEQWIREGCPCFRIRLGLDLFDEQEVRAWFERRQVEALEPILLRIHAANTPEDVAAITRDLTQLVTRGVISLGGAREVRRHLVRLARKLGDDQRRRRP